MENPVRTRRVKLKIQAHKYDKYLWIGPDMFYWALKWGYLRVQYINKSVFGCSKEPSHRDVFFFSTHNQYFDQLCPCQSKRAIWNDWTVWTGNKTNNKIGILVLYHIHFMMTIRRRRWYWDFSISLPTVLFVAFFYFCWCSSTLTIQEYVQSVKQSGSSTGPTFCRAWSGSKQFEKILADDTSM